MTVDQLVMSLFDVAGSIFHMMLIGLWHYKDHPGIFIPLYLWLTYGSITSLVNRNEEYLAGVEQLKRASLGELLLAAVLPLIPFLWIPMLVGAVWFTAGALFGREGPFSFLRWKPFE
jgi:hypothetical protein